MMRLFNWLLFCWNCNSQIRKIITSHFPKSSLKFFCCLINPWIWRIISFTVVPNKLQIVANTFNSWVFALIEFLIYCWEIHRILYYLWIICQSHTFPINRLPKIIGVAMIKKRLEYDFNFLLILFFDWRWWL